MFRFITIANLQGLESFEFSRLRIYDFLFLFPHFIKDVSFPRAKGVTALKRGAEKIAPAYERLPDRKRLFSEMGDYHIQALQILEAKGIFKEVDGIIRISESFQSSSVTNLLEDNQYINNEFYKTLLNTLNNIELSGDNGLKQRTGLMEYRYDAV
jgi:hypothetical protein